MPTQPRTPSQQANRANLALNSAAWRGLAQGDRDAWNAWSLTHPTVDSLGQTVKLTGAMCYNRVNTRLGNAGYAPVALPPSDDDPVSTPAVNVNSSDVAAIEFELAGSDPIAVVLLYVSPPRSQGVSFNGDYRFIVAAPNSDSGTTAVEISALLAAKYGTLVAGQKFFYRWEYLNPIGSSVTGGRGDFILT